MARRVTFSETDAHRIAAATRAYERGNRDQSPVAFRTVDDSDPVRLGKTTSTWTKGTLATIELYEEGTPPNETKKTPADTLASCVNKFATIASGKWVLVARGGNGSWYLIAAEC